MNERHDEIDDAVAVEGRLYVLTANAACWKCGRPQDVVAIAAQGLSEGGEAPKLRMISPDRIPPDETKPERERRVFRSFAADAATRGLVITLETIESKAPPEPDILCQVGALGPVAFELAEILDEDRKKVMATMMSAREALLVHLSTLPAAHSTRFHSKFSQRQINPRCQQRVRYRV
jgi:hypothetical protein